MSGLALWVELTDSINVDGSVDFLQTGQKLQIRSWNPFE